jgi:hypothetical protein
LGVELVVADPPREECELEVIGVWDGGGLIHDQAVDSRPRRRAGDRILLLDPLGRADRGVDVSVAEA